MSSNSSALPPLAGSDEFGLTEKDWQTIRQVLSVYAHRLKGIWIYGSRARGTHERASDVNFLIHAESDGDSLARQVRADFEESNLPYFVDVTVWSDGLDEKFKAYVLGERREIAGW